MFKPKNEIFAQEKCVLHNRNKTKINGAYDMCDVI